MIRIDSPTKRGVFRLDDRTPLELIRALRGARDGFLPQRRRVLISALTAAGSMIVISLYQMGVIRHLPEPPLPFLDADRVDASEEAYAWFSSPDAPLGLASYAGTAILASIGGRHRGQRHPWLPLALAAKTGIDAAIGAALTVDQWKRHRAFCSWCLLAAGASVASLAFALPEAAAVLRRRR